MSTATAKDFFGAKLDKEIYDEVIILPFANRLSLTGNFTLPSEVKSWEEFDFVKTFMGIGDDHIVYDTQETDKAQIKNNPTGWFSVMGYSSTQDRYVTEIKSTGKNTGSWSSVKTHATLIPYPKMIVGYKRRVAPLSTEDRYLALLKRIEELESWPKTIVTPNGTITAERDGRLFMSLRLDLGNLTYAPSGASAVCGLLRWTYPVSSEFKFHDIPLVFVNGSDARNAWTLGAHSKPRIDDVEYVLIAMNVGTIYTAVELKAEGRWKPI